MKTCCLWRATEIASSCHGKDGMREHDLELGEVDGDVVDVHRVRVLEPDPATPRESRPDPRVTTVEERGQTGLGHDLVQRVDGTVVRVEGLHVGVELEALDRIVPDQPPRLVDRPCALVRIDRRERDQDVGVRGRGLGDLLVRHRAPSRDGLRIDGEDDRCQLALAVVGGDVVDGRQRVVAEVRRRRLPPLRPEPVLARTTDLRVNVDVDRLDGGEVDRHAVPCLTRSCRSSDRR